MIYKARAPLRISFCGGGTDVSPYSDEHGGIVINTTINFYCHGTLRSRKDKKIKVYSQDFNIQKNYNLNEKQATEGELRLVEAVHNMFMPKQGYDLFLYSDAPPGTGLGSSGSMAAMLVGLFAYYCGVPLTRYDIAKKALFAEREILKIAGGKQDEYASVFGGFNLIEFRKRKNIVTPLRLEPWIIKELRDHLILCYTKKTRLSSGLIDKQVKYYKDGRATTINAMSRMKRIVIKMKNALLCGDLIKFGELLYEAGEMKKQMNPHVTDKDIDKFYETALKNGALGGKILGAGGGGFLLVMTKINTRKAICEALEALGGEIKQFDFDSDGIDTWSVPHNLTPYDLKL